MPREDIEKLLGGYATNTLTEQERKELFEAALGDQALFNALANEEALKEVLDEPRSRRLLIEALRNRQPQQSAMASFQIWWRQPRAWALAGSVAVALLAVTLVIRLTGPLPELRTASKAPAQPTSPSGVPESKPVPPPQASGVDKAQAPPSEAMENRTSQSLKRAPAAPLPDLRDEISSVPSNKDKPLSSMPPSVADEQTASPTGPLAKQEQEIRTTREGAAAPAPRLSESFSRGDGSKPEREQTAQGKLQAKASEEKALGGAREQGRRFSPMAGRATRSEDVRKNPAPGIRYTVLQERTDGTYSEVNPATTFERNDKARLAIEADESGYLYVLKRDAVGNSKLVFPPEGTGVTARVEKTVWYLVPPSGTFSFQQPGDVLLTIILSPEQVDDVQQFLDPVFGQKKRQTRGNVEGLAKEGAGKSAKSDLPAPPPIDPASVTRREITLKHH